MGKMQIVLLLVLLILSVFLIYSLFKFKKENYKKDLNIPIDVVYTWVDSYDPERVYYQQKLLKKTDFNNHDKKRYVQRNELKYSIKSIEKNCPWVRTIYIVVKDDQKPNFINFDERSESLDNSKNKIPIKLIKHSMIMPKSSLPTFSSLSIELCLHNIPNLSDYYIYMNDDLFINKPLTKSDFIKNGKPIVSVTPSNKPEKFTETSEYSYYIMYVKTLLLANKLTNQELYIFSPHVPSICYKPWDKEIELLLKSIPHKINNNLWDYSVHEKFRKNDSVALNSCFRRVYYIYKGAYKKDYYEKASDVYLRKDNNCNNYTIFKDKDIFLCVNDIEDKCKSFFNNEMLKNF